MGDGLSRLMKPRIYHRAKHIGPNGEVSALCFKKPRAIDMTSRETWTIRDEAVTCRKCKNALKRQGLTETPTVAGTHDKETP